MKPKRNGRFGFSLPADYAWAGIYALVIFDRFLHTAISNLKEHSM